MSAYLARLKQFENGKNSHYAPDSEPSKPSKVPFEPFEGMGTGHIEKKIIESETPKLETLQDQQREARRQKTIAMLEAAPGTRYAVLVTDASTDPVVVAVGIREIATFEMEIPHKYYDGMALLELIEKHSGEKYANN